MNLLFICKYNRFRSKVAESYFNKINKNKKIRTQSAGIFLDNSPPNNKEINEAKKLGIEINTNFQGMSLRLLDWADIIIIVADNVPKELFQKNNESPKRIITFDITDNHKSENEKIKKIIEKIKILSIDLNSKENDFKTSNS